MRCDDHYFDGLEATTWVARWELPLRKRIQKAIALDKPSTFDLANTLDDFSRQVKPSLLKGTSGPGTFKMLLRLISAHFDHGDRSVAIASSTPSG